MKVLSSLKFRVKKKKHDEIMKVNILAFITTIPFVLVFSVFLLITYVKKVGQSD